MNQTLLHILIDLFKNTLEMAFQEISEKDILSSLEVTQSTNEKFGHYQCNSAMKLTKILKKNPREIAQIIIDSLPSSSKDFIEKTEIAGPGFINITIHQNFLITRLHTILSSERLAIEIPPKNQRVIVEFSCPNTAKELHVGHLRSTIIGDCLARLFEFQGHDVLRLNHIGDWGTPFGMLIAYLKENHPQVSTGEKRTNLSELAHWYKESRKLFDSDEGFKKRSQEQVVLLQKGEEKANKTWKIICQISREAFEEIYSLLDIKLLERGESYYNSQLPLIVKELEEKGQITLSNGAKCIYLDGFINRDGEPLPMIVQKSDGGFNYDTTDMAAIKQRISEEKADRIVYVTDAGQTLHFQMFFEAAKKAGWWDPKKVRIDHVTFGLVLGSDGKKFKTRAGNTEKLIELLKESMVKAKEIIETRKLDLSDSEKEKLIKTLGIGAVKYADLSSLRTKDYTFSYEKMLNFEGNTAAFLLYAYVRIMGLKRKLGLDDLSHLYTHEISLNHISEKNLALHVVQFPEVLDLVSKDLLPNRLADYLYILADKFHAFFRDCRVVNSEYQTSRVLLAEATGKTLEKGLYILGLDVVEKM